MTATATTEIQAIADQHGLDAARINAVIDTLGDHRITSPRVEGDWLVWDVTRDERTMAKFADRLKRQYRASFMRRGRVGVHRDSLAA